MRLWETGRPLPARERHARGAERLPLVRLGGEKFHPRGAHRLKSVTANPGQSILTRSPPPEPRVAH